MDNALRAEWYDLADGDRAAYLDWLHNSHLPKLQAHPGVLWVGHYAISAKPSYMEKNKDGRTRAVSDDPTCPTGKEYVLLIGSSSPDVFFNINNPLPEDAEARDWFAKRVQFRDAVFIVEDRINGPEYRKLLPGTGAPPAIQFGNFNVRTPEDEFVLANYYRQVRFAVIPKTRGCIGMTKLLSVAGWPKHGILYTFDGMDEGEEVFEQRFKDANDGLVFKGKTIREYVVHAPNAPHAGKRIWPAL